MTVGTVFATVGDRADDGRVVWVLPDVAVVHGDAAGVEAPTEPITEGSTGPPEHLDGLDPTVGPMLGGDDGAIVHHPPDRPPTTCWERSY